MNSPVSRRGVRPHPAARLVSHQAAAEDEANGAGDADATSLLRGMSSRASRVEAEITRRLRSEFASLLKPRQPGHLSSASAVAAGVSGGRGGAGVRESRRQALLSCLRPFSALGSGIEAEKQFARWVTRGRGVFGNWGLLLAPSQDLGESPSRFSLRHLQLLHVAVATAWRCGDVAVDVPLLLLATTTTTPNNNGNGDGVKMQLSVLRDTKAPRLCALRVCVSFPRPATALRRQGRDAAVPRG